MGRELAHRPSLPKRAAGLASGQGDRMTIVAKVFFLGCVPRGVAPELLLAG